MSKLPESVRLDFRPVALDAPGWWLVLSDVHLPYHEPAAVEAAVREGRRHKTVGVILNGDVMDSHELSTFDKDPTATRYVDEVRVAGEFLAWLRDQFPKSRIVFKEGNHEERLTRYLMRKAPELFGLDVLSLPSLLGMADRGVEHVGEKKVIQLGKLNVVHGHEYRFGIQSPVNPARGLFLKAKGVAICGHLHQTSEHHEPTIDGKPIGCWSTGCLCQLSPPYSPLNKWNWGFAQVEVFSGGGFSVHNRRIIGASVY